MRYKLEIHRYLKPNTFCFIEADSVSEAYEVFWKTVDSQEDPDSINGIGEAK